MFVKGQSANPGGRPKSVKEVRALARQYTPEAIECLVREMRTGDTSAVRLSAANALLDRGHGRPAQAVVGSDIDPPIKMSIEAARAMALKALDDAFREPGEDGG